MLKIILLINGDGRTQILVCLSPKQLLFHTCVVSEMLHKLGLQKWTCLHVTHRDKGLVGRRTEPLFLFLYHFFKKIVLILNHDGKKENKASAVICSNNRSSDRCQSILEENREDS